MPSSPQGATTHNVSVSNIQKWSLMEKKDTDRLYSTSKGWINAFKSDIPCKTLLEFTVGWAAGALANDTTLAITGVESFLRDGGPAEAAGTMEILANKQKFKKPCNLYAHTKKPTSQEG